MSYISHENAGRHSVANAAEIVCFNTDYDDALQALLSKGVSGHDATHILNNPAEPSEWFPTILSALNYTVADVESVVETLPTNETTDNLEAKLLDVGEQVSALAQQFAAERQQSERKERIVELEAAINSAIPSYRQHLQRNTLVIGTLDDETVRQIILRDTAEGRELMGLRRAA